MTNEEAAQQVITEYREENEALRAALENMTNARDEYFKLAQAYARDLAKWQAYADKQTA